MNLLAALISSVHPKTLNIPPPVKSQVPPEERQTRPEDRISGAILKFHHGTLCSFWDAVYSGGILSIKLFALLCSGWHYGKFRLTFSNVTARMAGDTALDSQKT